MYWALGDIFIDRRFLTDKLIAIGLGYPGRYAAGALYWILVNSVLEEYAWRWFCVEKCEALLSRRKAIVCSALFFTLHHILAMTVFFGPAAVIISALGIFTGGIIWSLMYIKYRSIWPGYVSHAIVDLCIFGIGAVILFKISFK
jgi:membrane protease YdiL (CAAX protease family)